MDIKEILKLFSESSNNETRTYEITANESTFRTLERFFAMLQYNSNVGHSATFAVELDFDGGDSFKVEPNNNEFNRDADSIGSVGGDVEIARSGSYTCKDFKDSDTYWESKNSKLYKDNEEIK